MVPTPQYFRFSEKERETLLSQIGVNSDVQRQIFHEIITNGMPDFGYHAFVNPRTARIKNVSGELEGLFRRLQENKMGVITQKKSEQGDWVPSRLILTEENAEVFWYYLLEPILLKTLEKASSPYLTVEVLERKNIPLDKAVLKELPRNELNKGFIEAARDTEVIYTFEARGGIRPLVLSNILGKWVSSAIQKVLYNLTNADHQAAVARPLGSSLTDLQKNIAARDINFWKQMSSVILAHKEDFEADRRLRFDENFFLAADILETFMSNQLQEARQAKERDKQKREDMLKILEEIRTDEEVLVPATDVEKILESHREHYQESLELFKEEFWDRFGQTKTRTGLPHLVYLQEHYIHRNNVYPQVLAAVGEVKTAIKANYEERMSRILRGRKDPEFAFTNEVNLEKSVWKFIEGDYPFLFEVFKKSHILAEGLIHFARLKRKEATVDDLKPQLQTFFIGENMSLRRLVEIFHLDMLELFEEAFKGLPWWKQFWMHISGQFKNYKATFKSISSFETVGPKGEGLEPPSKSDGDSNSMQDPLDGLSPRERARERARQYAMRQAKARKEKKSKPPPEPRQYTKRERDTAWKSFGDNIKNKDE